MSEEDLKEMQKKVRKLKRIASEKAGELHDLVEDRLPAAYEEIPSVASATYEACKAWAEAEEQLSAQTGENAA
ncbi:MAG: CCE_0567 family metalloprotein [Pseudomonadota bacterium]